MKIVVSFTVTLLYFYCVYQDKLEILLYELTSLTQRREIEMTFLNEFRGNSSRQSNLAHLATDTVGRHRSGEESVPQVSSTYITVSHHHHCNCAVMSLSIVSSSCLCGCVRHASHLCPVFSFSPSPPFYFFFSLCWMRRQVLGRQRMTASCR